MSLASHTPTAHTNYRVVSLLPVELVINVGSAPDSMALMLRPT
jgi:hypothetical protein